MNFIFQFWKTFFCYAWAPLYAGDNQEQQQNQTSTSNTYNTDNRAITTVSSYDLSNHSVNAWSDASTTITNNTTTDHGAVAGALGFADKAAGGAFDSVKSALGFAASVASGQQAATIHAYDYADTLFDGALDFANKNDNRAYDAFDRAATIQKDALSMSAAAAKEALGQVQNAYADAKGTTQSQQKIMLGVLAVAGLSVFVRMKG
jgi:hypothetical protein